VYLRQHAKGGQASTIAQIRHIYENGSDKNR